MLVTAGGCTTLLGVNQDYHGELDYHGVLDDGGGGEQATNSSASSTGTMGTGGEAATTSAATSGTGGGLPACVVTHKGKGTCEYLPGMECGCPDPTTKCAVTEEKTGESSCIQIGVTPTPAWSGCDTDNDCAAGTWCDLNSHVCKPICIVEGDCNPGAHCFPMLQSTVNTPIPSLKACTAHCEPQAGSPCGPGVTCFQDETGEFDCARSQNKVIGATCTLGDDCGKGLLCIGSMTMFTCEKWCHPADAFSGACPFDKSYCTSFSTAVTYNGAQYGYCAAP